MAAHTALLAIEQRVRSQTAAQLSAISTHVSAYLGAVIREHPDLTATEILSRDDVHQTLTTVLNGAQLKAETSTSAGYKAAAALALVATAVEFKDLGHQPKTLPALGGYLDAIIRGIRLAFARALLDIHNTVRPAHDGVTGPNPGPARVLTTHSALKRVVRRLGVHVNTAAAFAVHRGFTDAQLALYEEYKQVNPYVALNKRWQVTANDPCPVCQALDGAVVAIDAEFDRGDALGVHRDLQGPPRHPNCRCRLSLEIGTTWHK